MVPDALHIAVNTPMISITFITTRELLLASILISVMLFIEYPCILPTVKNAISPMTSAITMLLPVIIAINIDTIKTINAMYSSICQSSLSCLFSPYILHFFARIFKYFCIQNAKERTHYGVPSS